MQDAYELRASARPPETLPKMADEEAREFGRIWGMMWCTGHGVSKWKLRMGTYATVNEGRRAWDCVRYYTFAGPSDEPAGFNFAISPALFAESRPVQFRDQETGQAGHPES